MDKVFLLLPSLPSSLLPLSFFLFFPSSRLSLPLLSRYFNAFLMAHSRDTALQVHKEYVDTMGKIYYSYFKDYHSKLMKLQVGEALDNLSGCQTSQLRAGNGRDLNYHFLTNVSPHTLCPV